MLYMHLFSVITVHLQTIVAHGGYTILFILTLLEGIPLIGMVVPGHIAIIIGGFLARIGTLNLSWVIVLSIAGAVIGDYIGFTIGRFYGMAFIDRLRPYFFVRDSHIAKARDLLGRHTGKAMIIGRFSPVTRALMPFLVGTSHTTVRRFWVWNIVGGVSWAVISVMIGYLFGAGYHVAAHIMGRYVLGAILLTVLIIWGYRFVNMRFHVFKRYELFTLALNVVSLWALAETIQDAWSVHSFMANFDIWVNQTMEALHQTMPVFASIANIVTTVGGTAVTGSLGALVGLWFLFRKRWRSGAIMLLSIGSTGILLGLMKEFFMRSRPENALQVIVNDPSFPSGHAGLAAAFFVILAYLLAPKINFWVKREVMIVLCVIAIILIGLSRLVLNVHWASDVIAGWALGTFMATASILLVRYVGVLIAGKVAKQGSA
jgi:membrane protein DedA with SNARE-associated domain